MLEVINILAVIVEVMLAIFIVLIILSTFISDINWRNAAKTEDDKRRSKNLNCLSGHMGLENKKSKGGGIKDVNTD